MNYSYHMGTAGVTEEGVQDRARCRRKIRTGNPRD